MDKRCAIDGFAECCFGDFCALADQWNTCHGDGFPENDHDLFDVQYPVHYHYDLAQLAKKGVLINESGNMIYNLKMIDWQNIDNNVGYDWAEELNRKFVQIIENKEHSKLFNIPELGEAGKLAIPTPDHYFPLLYSLGLQNFNEDVEIFNNHCVAGSLSMTSVKIG